MLWRKDGLTDSAENAYIRLELRRNHEARSLAASLQETCPGERLVPFWGRSKMVLVGALALLLVVGGSLVYAKFRQGSIRIIFREPVIRFENKSLEALARVIEVEYKVKVNLNQVRSRAYHFSGVLHTDRPVKEFLMELRSTGGIDFYFSRTGTLYFCEGVSVPVDH
ncbi:DUF4974 domain-containing protein [Olivibacter domesticus]|uniref:DUF4974 domain-containing protein n=1 Tax=Olivibacter domesticus TaxID=407022 RepID=UPI0011133E54|nr:DUF4974 domain-containing protein [Olivibacter domesticus]